MPLKKLLTLIAILALFLASALYITKKANTMTLKFEGPLLSTTVQQVEARTWRATPDDMNDFIIVSLKKQDMINMQNNRANFFGYEKPVEGVLEEITDVYSAAWVQKAPGLPPRVRPLVGNFMGGYASYGEAKQICEDAWRLRKRYQRREIVRASVLPPFPGTLN